MRTTRSRGAIRRHVLTAFRAPGTRSSAKTDGSSVTLGMLVRLLLRPESNRDDAAAVRQIQAVAGLVADVVHDLLEISARRLVDAQLSVGAGAVVQDPLDACDFLPRAELVDHVVHELEHFARELAKRNFLLLAEVDQLALDAIADGAPLVFEDQGATVAAPPDVLRAQLVELDADRLDQRGDRHGLVHAHRDVADAKLDRLEEGVRADVPPDLLAVVDA